MSTKAFRCGTEADYVYHPDNPGLNEFGTRGFPAVPGVLQAAVDQNVESVGLRVPWFTVYGNHDTLFMGNIQVESALASWAINDRKEFTVASDGESHGQLVGVELQHVPATR